MAEDRRSDLRSFADLLRLCRLCRKLKAGTHTGDFSALSSAPHLNLLLSVYKEKIDFFMVTNRISCEASLFERGVRSETNLLLSLLSL